MQASRWPKNLSVSVNFSAKQLGQADLYRTVTDCLAKYDLKASQLEIEVTETVLLSDDPELLKDLISLHELGVKLALDDFGTGYASLSYLQRLPFDKIKLDRSFVDTIGREDSALAIIRSTAQLARDLGMESVAEGVETTEQIEAIRSAGYSIGQGYYFGKPMPAGEFEALVRERAATRSPKAEYVI